MKELKGILINAIAEKIKSDNSLHEIERQICLVIEKPILERYKKTSLFRDNMEFELIKVIASLNTYTLARVHVVAIKLIYICKSKLPKVKRERLEKVKKVLDNDGYMPWNNYKIPLWHELKYDVNIDDALTGEVRLRID